MYGLDSIGNRLYHNLNIYETREVNLPGMYSDSPQKQTPPEDFFVDSSHETVQRLHHAYRHDFRYLTGLLLKTYLFRFRIFGYSSLSFDKVATGTTPEVFKVRRRRDIKLRRQHEFILQHLEKEIFRNLWWTLSAYKLYDMNHAIIKTYCCQFHKSLKCWFYIQ